MAVLGLAKLDAVNRMLRAVNELPFAALDTGGTSIAARAEETLDIVTSEILSRGFDENTVYCEVLTHSAGIFTVASDTLFVRPAGRDQWRKLTLRGDKVWNLTTGSNSWTGVATTLDVDRIYAVAFVDMSPRLKIFITKWATMIFQREYRGSGELHALLASDAFLSELAATRAMNWQSPPNPINPVPIMQPSPSAPAQ